MDPQPLAIMASLEAQPAPFPVPRVSGNGDSQALCPVQKGRARLVAQAYNSSCWWVQPELYSKIMFQNQKRGLKIHLSGRALAKQV